MAKPIDRDPSPLQPGDLLHEPLFHPITQQVLLAAGNVLTEFHIAIIQRLRIENEAIQAIAPPPREAPPPAAPHTPPGPAPSDAPPVPPRLETVHRIRHHAKTLEVRYSQAMTLLSAQEDAAQDDSLSTTIERIFSPDRDEDVSVDSAMKLVEAIIHRIENLGVDSLPDLRVYGGEATHPINVFLVAVTLGIALKLGWDDLISLGQAALLHDVGQYRLSPKILYKETPLTPTEERVFERHVEFGLDVLKNFHASFPKLNHDVYQAIRCHHERWDGSGYPQGLKGKQTLLIGRILAVADEYVTLSTDQPRSPRLTPGEAYHSVLGGSGTAFDPVVVNAFRQVIVPYPATTLLQLECGQVAQVTHPGRDPEHPIVQLGMGDGTLDLSLPGSPLIVRQIFPRKAPRVPIELPAAIQALDDAEASPAKVQNLSLGGTCLMVTTVLPIGTPVIVSLAVPEAELLTLEGQVVWRDEGRAGHAQIGVRFDPVPREAQLRLGSLIGRARDSARIPKTKS